jgi:hypothetical protein
MPIKGWKRGVQRTSLVDALGPSLPETPESTLRDTPETHRCVDQHMIDAPAVPWIEGERNEMCVTMSIPQSPTLAVLTRQLRTCSRTLLVTRLAQERPTEERHRRKRALHRRKHIASCVSRESE